jgi:ABC-type antimicrobial peptide transport system permease subunit
MENYLSDSVAPRRFNLRLFIFALLILVAIAAGAVPALRATKLDPLRALREE